MDLLPGNCSEHNRNYRQQKLSLKLIKLCYNQINHDDNTFDCFADDLKLLYLRDDPLLLLGSMVSAN